MIATTIERLLDAPPCTLDHVVFVDKERDNVNNHVRTSEPTHDVQLRSGGGNDDDANVQHGRNLPYYWLCYNESEDILSVMTNDDSLEMSSQSKYRILKLTLKDTPLNPTTAPLEDDETKVDDISKVGTNILHDDEWIRIWEFRLQPQEECDYHVHKLRYCFTNISMTSLTQELSKEKESVGEPRTQVQGQTIFVTKDLLGSHGVRNVGNTTFLQFIVEFKWE